MTTPTIGIACHSFRTDGGMGRYVQLLAEGLLNLGKLFKTPSLRDGVSRFV